jgi:hypothetical protein
MRPNRGYHSGPPTGLAVKSASDREQHRQPVAFASMGRDRHLWLLLGKAAIVARDARESSLRLEAWIAPRIQASMKQAANA